MPHVPRLISSDDSGSGFSGYSGFGLSGYSGYSGAAGSGGSSTQKITQIGHKFVVGDVLRFDGSKYVLAQSDNAEHAEVVGIVKEIVDKDTFILLVSGEIEGLSGLTPGSMYFLSASIAGQLTSIEPSTIGQVSKPLLLAISETSGFFVNWRGIEVFDPFSFSSGGGASSEIINQSGHGFVIGDVVRFNGTIYVLAQADSAEHAEVVGIVSEIIDEDTFVLLVSGEVDELSGLTPGSMYFLSASIAGQLTDIEPSVVGQISKPLLLAISSTTGFFFNWRGIEVFDPFSLPIGTSGFSGYSGGGGGGGGESGFSGYSGLSGFSGYSGPSGFSGYSGISGFSGYSGISGFSGYSGRSGFSGYSGVSGFSGYSGISGFSGYSGRSGFSGYSGISGFSGYSGSGFSGYSGSGFSGYSGSSGGIPATRLVQTGDGLQGGGDLSTDRLISVVFGVVGGTVMEGNDPRITGTSGFSGYSGAGSSGFSGYSGISGFSGFSGFSGYSGRSGFSGYSGSGFSGYSGISGFSGYSGISGFSGYSGRSGFSGYSGISGFSGTAGSSVLYWPYSTSDITTTSSTTYASISDLVSPTIAASENWNFEYILDLTSSDFTGGGFKFRLQLPTSATAAYFYACCQSSQTLASGPTFTHGAATTTITSDTVSFSFAGSTLNTYLSNWNNIFGANDTITDIRVIIKFTLKNGSNSGTVNLQTAQSSSNATGFIVKTGSTMKCMKATGAGAGA